MDGSCVMGSHGGVVACCCGVVWCDVQPPFVGGVPCSDLTSPALAGHAQGRCRQRWPCSAAECAECVLVLRGGVAALLRHASLYISILVAVWCLLAVFYQR
jgi:hypothetical protein